MSKRVVLLACVHAAAFLIELICVGQLLRQQVEGMGGLVYFWYFLSIPVFMLLIAAAATGKGLPLIIADGVYIFFVARSAGEPDTVFYGPPGLVIIALYVTSAVIAWSLRRMEREPDPVPT